LYLSKGVDPKIIGKGFLENGRIGMSASFSRTDVRNGKKETFLLKSKFGKDDGFIISISMRVPSGIIPSPAGL